MPSCKTSPECKTLEIQPGLVFDHLINEVHRVQIIDIILGLRREWPSILPERWFQNAEGRYSFQQTHGSLKPILQLRVCQKENAMAIIHSFLLLTFAAAVSMVSGEGCKVPPVSFGTTHNGGDTLVFSTGQSLQYTCDFGHYSVGPTTRLCRDDGTWSESDTICRLDVVSLSLACIGGLTAIFIFFTLSCWLVTRRTRAERRAERRLTIRKENDRGMANGGLDDPGEVTHPAYNPRKSQITERSDSGLQTDLDNEETNLNDFDITIDSPTDNRSAHTSDFQLSVDDIE